MRITIETENLKQAIAEFDRAGRGLAPAADRGMRIGADVIGNHIKANFLTGQALRVRTGNLRKATAGWMEGPMHAVIGVQPNLGADKYAWLMGDDPENQPKTIRPKNAKFLAIPIGEALTGAGVPKWSGPREAEQELGKKNMAMIPMKKNGQFLFGYRAGKTERAKFRPLFVLVKSVQVYDTGALIDGVEEKIDAMTDAIQREIDRVMD